MAEPAVQGHVLVGHDFVPAVKILKGWLDQYRRDLGESDLTRPGSSKEPDRAETDANILR